MASNQPLTRTALTLLSRWPADPLRPTAQLGAVLSRRLAQDPSRLSPFDAASPPDAQVRAIAALLDNTFARKYAPRPDRSATTTADGAAGGMMRPRGNPGYYEELIRDLEELPTRTWWDRLKVRLGGMFRFA